ncbi:uncharacterized protein LOC62_04G005233 [Vanrija pseudolonga]|uniref:Uncharacterized protein n=1 Tax=Vanrija pseudolonga TaxID=143232 RepID=A0AAF0YDW2_9TREE|nr:hypothetical protein LOC62_04G005233 [Vanrija pseudolonga]
MRITGTTAQTAFLLALTVFGAIVLGLNGSLLGELSSHLSLYNSPEYPHRRSLSPTLAGYTPPLVARLAGESNLHRRKKGGGGDSGSSGSGPNFHVPGGSSSGSSSSCPPGAMCSMMVYFKNIIPGYIVVEVWSGLVVLYAILQYVCALRLSLTPSLVTSRIPRLSSLMSVNTDHVAHAILLALGVGGAAALSAGLAADVREWRLWILYTNPAMVYANLAMAWILWAILFALAVFEVIYVRRFFPGAANRRKSLRALDSQARSTPGSVDDIETKTSS